MQKSFPAEFDESQPIVGWRSPAPSRHSKWVSDIGLGLAGVGAAFASAAFAFVMLQADIKTPSFGGAEYLSLFTRPLRPAGERQMATRPPDRDIDMSPTGSINVAKGAPRAGAGEARTDLEEWPEPKAALKDYVLQTVQGGVAIIHGPTGRFSVESGSLMPNGDKVISIDRRGGRWVVVTTSGLIERQ